MSESRPTFFITPGDFRKWLEKNHRRFNELWVGFYKTDSGRPSITWPESVDQALCFGWIDGLRKSIDAHSYKIRFTPRRPKSIWSKINIARVTELKKLGLMGESGLKAFKARDPSRANIYSSESPLELSPAFVREFKKNATAWGYFNSCPPWYRKVSAHWVMSAKREKTRRRRFDTLLNDSNAERYIKAVPRPDSKSKE